MRVSAEGRVEHQKRNQAATSQRLVGFVFGIQIDYLCWLKSVSSDAINRSTRFSPSDKTLSSDIKNRVEHKKQNQLAIAKWPFGLVFGNHLGAAAGTD